MPLRWETGKCDSGNSSCRNLSCDSLGFINVCERQESTCECMCGCLCVLSMHVCVHVYVVVSVHVYVRVCRCTCEFPSACQLGCWWNFYTTTFLLLKEELLSLEEPTPGPLQRKSRNTSGSCGAPSLPQPPLLSRECGPGERQPTVSSLYFAA